MYGLLYIHDCLLTMSTTGNKISSSHTLNHCPCGVKQVRKASMTSWRDVRLLSQTNKLTVSYNDNYELLFQPLGDKAKFLDIYSHIYVFQSTFGQNHQFPNHKIQAYNQDKKHLDIFNHVR